MNRYSNLLTGLALAGFTSSAMAADLPTRVSPAQPYVPAPVANWTGFYVGGGGGYGLYDADSSSVFAGIPGINGTTGGKGWFGTVQVGGDLQFAGNWVAGIFGDWDFASIKGTLLDANSNGRYGLKETSAWAVGGRVGYLITPQILSYFTGGYTAAQFKSATGVCATPFGCPVAVITLPKSDYTGYFLGGGTEVLLGFAPGWSVKTEYRLAHYSSQTVGFTSAPAIPGGATATIKPVVQTIRSELVYKFNWGR
jgi:outer membrane immunogenic protein